MIAIVSGLATGLVLWVMQPSDHTPPNMPAAMRGPAPVAAGAAGEVDARWRPWLGCWQLWEEQLDPSAADEVSETADLLDRTLVCVRPEAETGGVNLTAEAGDQVLVDRTLVADGVRRDVAETDCTGWERSEWSADGRRLFTRAELQCSDQPARRVTGVSLMASAATWADIQVIEVGGRQLVEVRRYAPLRPAEQDARLGADAIGIDWIDVNEARRNAAARLDLPAVIDASERTSARAVEALLVETEPTLPLDGDALVALDDAGISGGVIDLLVALAYPERFVVERRDRGGSWSSGGWRGFSGFHDPIWYNSYYPYYVTPLGYHFWSRGYYDPYLYGGFATPFVVLADGGGGVDEPSGRAVPGMGFTRVSQRGWSGGGGSGVVPGGFTSGGGSSSGGSSGGTVSRGGFSSGGSSGGGGGSRGGSGGGRTAVPRR